MTFEHFSVDKGVLTYRERLSIWSRTLVVFFALAMLMIPLIWVRAFPENADVVDWLGASLAIVLPVLVSALFLRMALVGVKHMHFDAAHRLIHLTTRWPLFRRETRIAYQHVERIDVVKHEGLDEPPHYSIRLHVRGLRPIGTVGFANVADAELWKQRLIRELGASSPAEDRHA